MHEKHTYIPIKTEVQMVFLMMNTWCSKHIEDTKKWIKALIWKVCICWFTLHYRAIIIIIIIIIIIRLVSLVTFSFYLFSKCFRLLVVIWCTFCCVPLQPYCPHGCHAHIFITRHWTGLLLRTVPLNTWQRFQKAERKVCNMNQLHEEVPLLMKWYWPRR